MRQLPCVLVLVVSASLALGQSYSPEEQEIVAQVRQNWEDFANKNYDALVRGPMDLVRVQAGSHGGLWVASTNEEWMQDLKEQSYTLRASPHHIQVMFLGSAKDVAYVTFYLVGNILLENQVIDDYRTRASLVLEKVGGEWVDRGAHYSRLFGGSGIPATN